MDISRLTHWIEHAPVDLERDHLSLHLLNTLLELVDAHEGILLQEEAAHGGYRLMASHPMFPAWHDLVLPNDVVEVFVGLKQPHHVCDHSPAAVHEACRSLVDFLRMRSSGTLRLEPWVIVPVPERHHHYTAVFVLSRGPEEVSAEHLSILRAIAVQAGHCLHNAQRFERLCVTMQGFAECISMAIDAKDPHAEGHSRAVSHYAGMLARQVGLPAREVHTIEFAGLLHDIGRLGIPDEVLLKTGQLTEDELAIIRSYPVRGADFVSQVEGLEAIVSLVRHHAERFDGSGYPNGLGGSDIPQGARILAVAHAFVAMITRRSYRGRMTVVGGAMKALEAMSGNVLDPDLVRAFLHALGRGKRG